MMLAKGSSRCNNISSSRMIMGDEGVADAVIFVFRFQNKGVWTRH